MDLKMQERGPGFSNRLDRFADQIVAEASAIEGFLSEREMRFLVILGAVRTARGEVLEIGSFKGRSTVILARSAALAGDRTIHAVDPLNAPSATDPDLCGKESTDEDLETNLVRSGVKDLVDFHKTRSAELAVRWCEPLRLLWIDGDHTYEGAHTDLRSFASYLEPGAIVALHDVLHEFDGPVRVFAEEILASPDYWPAGFCGSIGWAQYRPSQPIEPRWQKKKQRLLSRVTRLAKLQSSGDTRGTFGKLRYKLGRWRIPHRKIDTAEWLRSVTL